MANSYILDTHALLWYLEGNRRLGNRARAAIASPENQFFIPIIALAEASVVIENRRTKIPSTIHLLESLAKDYRFEIYPLTLEILEHSLSSDLATIPELHDRLIMGTALYLQALGQSPRLITRDLSLMEAKLVPTIW